MFLPILTTAIMLGRSFDLQQLQPLRSNIFEPKESEKMRIESTYTRTEYKLVESSADVNEFLDVQGELSLKMKKLSFDSTATGAYLKETVDRTETVELLLRMTFENYTETFPTYTKQVDGWFENRRTATHFIRSIVYGGQLIITYRLKSKSTKDLQDIKAAVKLNLEASSGSVNLDVQGKLAMINKAVSEKSKVEIKAYYVGQKDLPPTLSSLEQVFSLIDEYPSRVAIPVPLRFELESLSTLRPKDFPKQNKHNVVNQILDDVNDKYDDVRVYISKRDEFFYLDYLENYDKFAKQEADIFVKVRDINNKLERAIRKVDMSKPFNSSLFSDALSLYTGEGYNVPNRFTRQINQLINDLKNYVPPWYPYTRAVNEYTHWGNTTCSLPSPDPIFVGFAVGTPKGFGSGSDILCVSPKPVLVPKGTAAPPAATAAISALAYHDREGMEGALVCARCMLENATSVITVPAKKECPEGTKLEYEGFLATGGDAVTDLICVDGRPVDRHPDYTEFDEKKLDHVNFVKPVWMKCSGEDCEQEESYVLCVVCSR